MRNIMNAGGNNFSVRTSGRFGGAGADRSGRNSPAANRGRSSGS